MKITTKFINMKFRRADTRFFHVAVLKGDERGSAVQYKMVSGLLMWSVLGLG